MVEHSSFDIGYTCNYKVVSLHDSNCTNCLSTTLPSSLNTLHAQHYQSMGQGYARMSGEKGGKLNLDLISTLVNQSVQPLL